MKILTAETSLVGRGSQTALAPSLETSDTADPRLRLRQQMVNSRFQGGRLCRTGRHAHWPSVALEFTNVTTFAISVRLVGEPRPTKLVSAVLFFRVHSLFFLFFCAFASLREIMCSWSRLLLAA
jgi:hypothetical protein